MMEALGHPPGLESRGQVSNFSLSTWFFPVLNFLTIEVVKTCISEKKLIKTILARNLHFCKPFVSGLPWELGLAETHQALTLKHLRSRIVVQVETK